MIVRRFKVNEEHSALKSFHSVRVFPPEWFSHRRCSIPTPPPPGDWAVYQPHVICWTSLQRPRAGGCAWMSSSSYLRQLQCWSSALRDFRCGGARLGTPRLYCHSGAPISDPSRLWHCSIPAGSETGAPRAVRCSRRGALPVRHGCPVGGRRTSFGRRHGLTGRTGWTPVRACCLGCQPDSPLVQRDYPILQAC